MTIGACAAAVWGAAVVTSARTGLQPAMPARVDFQQQIQPIIAKHCLECHSQDRRRGGLSLASYGDAMDGGKNGPSIRPANGAGSPLIHRLTGAAEPQMPKDEPPLAPAEIALIKRWIDQGARETPTSRPATAPWEAPLALARPPVPAVRLARWSSPLDRFVGVVPREARRHATRRRLRRAVRAPRVSRRLGTAAEPGRAPGLHRRRAIPESATALVATLLANDAKYAEHWISFWNDLLRNEDGVTYFSETAGRKSITDWLLGALTTNLPYDQFVVKLLNPATPGDPEGFLIGRELARRDERGGDPVDAGVAEHRAGVPRDQPEVQRLPRQLREQVEAEGRLCAGGVFLAGAAAGAVSLRRGAGRVRRAGVPVSRA